LAVVHEFGRVVRELVAAYVTAFRGNRMAKGAMKKRIVHYHPSGLV
jgi:hypothetical protein